MTYHTMILSEAHATRVGFISKYYATIDVAMAGNSWHWRQVDFSGHLVGAPSSPFQTEDQAMDDALRTLDGDGWE